MHVRVRVLGQPDTVVAVDSKLSKIERFRILLEEKFSVIPELQRLFYGGKLLEDGYTFHDYNIRHNDVIQLMERVLPVEKAIPVKNEEKVIEELSENNVGKEESEDENYTDAQSHYYAIGDMVDVQDKENGAWREGKVIRIVLNPDNLNNSREAHSSDMESDSENNPPTDDDNENESKKVTPKSIVDYFSRMAKKKQDAKKKQREIPPNPDKNLLFKIELVPIYKHDQPSMYCGVKELRPRARSVINIEDLTVGQTVMINYNSEHPSEKGWWFDFKVDMIKKLRTTHELVGTLYLGPDAVAEDHTRIKVHDKIFAIETVVPVSERNKQTKETMATEPVRRSKPIFCLTCRDDESLPCRDCGCYVCSGQEDEHEIIMCDECDHGYHFKCLDPPLTGTPEGDWYCPACKRDTNDVIAPGAAKQKKKTAGTKTQKDWGRGMACASKTKTCAMPLNHFGPIPGVEVGMRWGFRMQLSELGVHRPPVSGIHGRDTEGAYSIVLSGGYEDDVDNGDEFTYTGSGGRDLSGNKRTAGQSSDQKLTRENRALARNCAAPKISECGGDAGDKWRDGKPVRVVRSSKMKKFFPKYAPHVGIRYDGIYKVVKYYPEQGISGFRMWKYLLRRDDPSPAPWEPDAQKYPVVYPEGYLESLASKKALKEQDGKRKKGAKRALMESNHSSESSAEDDPQPAKKRKTRGTSAGNKRAAASPNKCVTESEQPTAAASASGGGSLSVAERDAMRADDANAKLWAECLAVGETRAKKEFVDHVTQMFLCIICQELAANPVTTPCLHNFCTSCLKNAFKVTSSQNCPACRQSLAKYSVQTNAHLQSALRTILPGYDAGRK